MYEAFTIILQESQLFGGHYKEFKQYSIFNQLTI